MNQNSPSTLLGEALLHAIRQAVREEIQAANNGHSTGELLTPEQIADRLKVLVSWVYEQSRQGKFPPIASADISALTLPKFWLTRQKSKPLTFSLDNRASV